MPAELTLGALSDIAERARPTGDMAFRRLGGAWTPVPWSALRSFRREVAAALHEHGVRHGDRVAILSHTCWEWGALDLAITTLGAISVGVYPTSTAEQIGYILHHAKVKVCFAEAAQLERLRATFATVPGMKLMVIGPELDGFRAEGREVLKREPTLPEERLRGVSTDDDATWVYTSGTSGPPKGAVLTHQGVLAMSRLGAEQIGAKPGDVAVSYLPMAHVLTRVNYYAYVRLGGMAWYAESLEKVAEAWLAARPSIVSLVPRVLEKAQARILDAIEKSSPTRQKIFKRALAVGLKKLDYVERGEPVPFALGLEASLWARLVNKKLKERLGWDNARFAMCGGAPTRPDVIRFFHALGLPVLEGYGLTETSSPVTLNLIEKWRIGTVGRPLKGVELKLAEDGEILVRSPGVFRRYEGDESATKAAFDDDGFFRTGDIGTLDAEGFLRITDRKRDIIITAGGKNVAPQNIEAVIREDSRVSMVAVHGDKRAYLVALVTLSAPGEGEGAFGEDSAEHKVVQEILEKANSRLAPYETIKKHRVLRQDFTVENGLLTPTLKVKRRAVEDRHRALLDGMY